MHASTVPAAHTVADMVDHILVSDNRSKRRIISTLLRSVVPDTAERMMAIADRSISKQLAALRWNRLPAPILSCVFSYLPAKWVIQLRGACRLWNEVGVVGVECFSTS